MQRLVRWLSAQRRTYGLQCVLVDLAILDNHVEDLEFADDLDVLQRIAIDQQQISEHTFFHDAQKRRIESLNERSQ